ncbi:MAG TPA: RNA polymerase sigma factor [Acidimicrobiales bacterium]|nr:RNA polymerase sigma factor [Acidimicrobiales bacterium]
MAAQRGDPLAMDALLTELAPWVGRVCSAIALGRGEDAMQETLILVLRNLPTLRQPGALRGWVRRIAVRQALRMAGDSRMVSVPEPPEVPVAPDVDTGIDVRETLSRMSPSQRALLVLRDLEDLSERESAELLGVPEGTVKSGLHRARESFRERWEG